jgi:hypothetical protein
MSTHPVCPSSRTTAQVCIGGQTCVAERSWSCRLQDMMGMQTGTGVADAWYRNCTSQNVVASPASSGAPHAELPAQQYWRHLPAVPTPGLPTQSNLGAQSSDVVHGASSSAVPELGEHPVAGVVVEFIPLDDGGWGCTRHAYPPPSPAAAPPSIAQSMGVAGWSGLHPYKPPSPYVWVSRHRGLPHVAASDPPPPLLLLPCVIAASAAPASDA